MMRWTRPGMSASGITSGTDIGIATASKRRRIRAIPSTSAKGRARSADGNRRRRCGLKSGHRLKGFAGLHLRAASFLDFFFAVAERGDFRGEFRPCGEPFLPGEDVRVKPRQRIAGQR
jgi:hypothetical protein